MSQLFRYLLSLIAIIAFVFIATLTPERPIAQVRVDTGSTLIVPSRDSLARMILTDEEVREIQMRNEKVNARGDNLVKGVKSITSEAEKYSQLTDTSLRIVRKVVNNLNGKPDTIYIYEGTKRSRGSFWELFNKKNR